MTLLLHYIIVYLTHSYVNNIEAARILAVFPTPSISHQVVFRSLTQELVKRGHEVVVVTPDPVFPKQQTPENLTEIDVHDVSYFIWKKNISHMKIGNKDDVRRQREVIFDTIPNVFEGQLKNEEFINLIDNKRDYFDLLLVEACARPALALSHIFKVPVVQISSLGRYFGNNEIIGAPAHPILYPIFTRQRIYNLTFWEKITELYNHYVVQIIYDFYEEIDNKMLNRSLSKDFSKLSEARRNVDKLFLNTHPIWDGNQPVPPNVIYLWGLYQKPIKELPEDLKSYLDASVNGVIYMSFGTNALPSTLSPEKIQIFIKVLSELPYDVLLKWDKDKLPGGAKNIRIRKWFPQSDLLRHPKIKLFITQGGLQSTDEAMMAGVPLIGVPIFSDQWFNSEKFVHHKIGEKLDFETLTEDQLRNAINTVIDDENYRRNIIKLRALMQDQPQTSLERAVWWTEHVLRHGSSGRHLRAPAANMSSWQFLELELVFCLLFGLIVFIFASLCIVHGSCRYALGFFVRRRKFKTN